MLPPGNFPRVSLELVMKELIDTEKLLKGEDAPKRHKSHSKTRHHTGHAADKKDNYRAGYSTKREFEERRHRKAK